ncbi:unnamed protein product, partial [Rotaria magnacalcarata]
MKDRKSARVSVTTLCKLRIRSVFLLIASNSEYGNNNLDKVGFECTLAALKM